MFGKRNRNNAALIPLNYDTQIELVFPDALYKDPIIAPMLKQVGIEMEAEGNKILLFTDVRTVAALNANKQIEEVIRKARVGTVLYVWNSKGKISFLTGELRSIADKYNGDDAAKRLAVFDLHRYVFSGMLGQIDPNPFASPIPSVHNSETFDLAAAIAFMQSPDQISKPKAQRA